MRGELRRILVVVLELPTEEMAGFLGEVGEFRCKTMVRLVATAPVSGTSTPEQLGSMLLSLTNTTSS
jgi:hypothetical protein